MSLKVCGAQGVVECFCVCVCGAKDRKIAALVLSTALIGHFVSLFLPFPFGFACLGIALRVILDVASRHTSRDDVHGARNKDA